MKKVINVYYDEENRGMYDTGLILELEDGTLMKGFSTDVINPFEEIKIENSSLLSKDTDD